MCPTPNCSGAGFTFDIFPTDPSHPANEGWHYDDDDDDEDGDEDDGDIEGEEWKYGLAPGERPPEPDWMEQARLEHEEEERGYDEPDERPRTIDWSDREDRKPRAGPAGDDDDDIPF